MSAPRRGSFSFCSCLSLQPELLLHHRSCRHTWFCPEQSLEWLGDVLPRCWHLEWQDSAPPGWTWPCVRRGHLACSCLLDFRRRPSAATFPGSREAKSQGFGDNLTYPQIWALPVTCWLTLRLLSVRGGNSRSHGTRLLSMKRAHCFRISFSQRYTEPKCLTLHRSWWVLGAQRWSRRLWWGFSEIRVGVFLTRSSGQNCLSVCSLPSHF